jgi:hypothetical protein
MTSLFRSCWVGLVVAAPALAQTPDPASLPELKARDAETVLALDAAPEALRAGAGVYVLERLGYVKARESSNGFTCIVNRDHPRAIKPTCYDAEGTATILPAVLRFGELLMQGKPVPEIQADIRKGFEQGKFISPRRPGVAYMLSGEIANVDPQTGRITSFPPHVMFYAPNLSNADIGASPASLQQNPGLPFIAYQGPHGFMVVVIGDQG